MAATPLSHGVRAQIFEIVVKQAMAGLPWKEISAGPLGGIGISEEEVEKEVQRRRDDAATRERRQALTLSDPEPAFESKPSDSAACLDPSIKEFSEAGKAQVIETVDFTELLEKYKSKFAIFEAMRNESGESCKVEEIKDAIARIYARQGLAPPVLLVAEGPFQFHAFPILLHDFMAAMSGDFPIDSKLVIQGMKAQLPSESESLLIKRLWKSFEDQLPQGKIASGLGDNLSTRLCMMLIKEFLPELADRVEQRFSAKFKLSVESLGRAEFGNPMFRLRDACRRLVRNVAPKFERDLYYLHHKYSQLYLTANSARFDEGWGAWELHWLPVYASAEALNLALPESKVQEPLFTQSQSEELSDWMKLLSNAFAYLMMENACIILNFPKQALDQNQRLHSQSEPALVFADGQKLYAFHGIVVPDWVITRKKMINPFVIDRTDNIETRRVMIEIFGWEKYMRSFGSKLVHSDKFGKLYHRRVGQTANQRRLGVMDEDVWAVEVVNSTAEPDGKFKKYLLRVPPTMRTAKEAVAWTFGLRSEDYEPKTET